MGDHLILFLVPFTAVLILAIIGVVKLIKFIKLIIMNLLADSHIRAEARKLEAEAKKTAAENSKREP